LLVEKRFRLGHGRLFALYGLLYVLGRGWIEYLRVDTANHIVGLRLNIWTSIIVGAVAIWYLATHRGDQEMLATSADGKVTVVGEATGDEVITNDVITDEATDAEPAVDEPAEEPDDATDEGADEVADEVTDEVTDEEPDSEPVTDEAEPVADEAPAPKAP
ncbi:MAG: hypothetical protein QOF98_1657, partial [Streptomyces sp.]|nr:hypothetical protein [Streptomyces sp.]